MVRKTARIFAAKAAVTGAISAAGERAPAIGGALAIGRESVAVAAIGRESVAVAAIGRESVAVAAIAPD